VAAFKIADQAELQKPLERPEALRHLPLFATSMDDTEGERGGPTRRRDPQHRPERPIGMDKPFRDEGHH
jgi:hypothetical protein